MEGLAGCWLEKPLASHLHIRASKVLQGEVTLLLVPGKQTYRISSPEWSEALWGRSPGDTQGSEASCWRREHLETVSRGSMRSFFSISSLPAPSPLFYFLLTRMKVNVNSKQ